MVYKLLRAMRTRFAYVQTISLGETPSGPAALPPSSDLMSLPTTVMCVAVAVNAFALSQRNIASFTFFPLCVHKRDFSFPINSS